MLEEWYKSNCERQYSLQYLFSIHICVDYHFIIFPLVISKDYWKLVKILQLLAKQRKNESST